MTRRRWVLESKATPSRLNSDRLRETRVGAAGGLGFSKIFGASAGVGMMAAGGLVDTALVLAVGAGS